MKRTVMFLGAAMLAALGFGCVAPPPPPPPMPRLACDATPFLQKVAFLQKGFNPELHGTPLPDKNRQPTVAMLEDLGDAYCMAPDFFKSLLVNHITEVFINQNDCSSGACFANSWGYRELPLNPGAGRYIALSETLWSGQDHPHAVKYYSFATDLLHALLGGWSKPKYTPPPQAPSNTSAMTVLAVLAHEYGHILWYDIVDPLGNGVYNLGNVCTNGAFFTNSWDKKTLAAPPQWRKFLSYDERRVHPVPAQHVKPPQIQAVDQALGKGNFSTTGRLLAQLYAASPPTQPISVAQPWASFFGALSPDEDFVETFKFLVLTNAGLNTLPLTIPVGAGLETVVNIPVDYKNKGKKELNFKVDCIEDLLHHYY